MLCISNFTRIKLLFLHPILPMMSNIKSCSKTKGHIQTICRTPACFQEGVIHHPIYDLSVDLVIHTSVWYMRSFHKIFLASRVFPVILTFHLLRQSVHLLQITCLWYCCSCFQSTWLHSFCRVNLMLI